MKKLHCIRLGDWIAGGRASKSKKYPLNAIRVCSGLFAILLRASSPCDFGPFARLATAFRILATVTLASLFTVAKNVDWGNSHIETKKAFCSI